MSNVCNYNFCSFYIAFIAENLSRKHTTKVSQSSTYSDYYATRANDGITATNDAYCAHTTLHKPLAWFQVDLGQDLQHMEYKNLLQKRWYPLYVS